MPESLEGLTGLLRGLEPVLRPVRLRSDADELKVHVDITLCLCPYCFKLSQVLVCKDFILLGVSVLQCVLLLFCHGRSIAPNPPGL